MGKGSLMDKPAFGVCPSHYEQRVRHLKANNNYIKRMLLSYLPILFITVSVLIFIFFSIMNQLYVRNSIQANRLTAEYVANMVDGSLKEISLDTQKLLAPGGTVQQFLDGPSDQILDYHVSNLLSDLMVRYSLIDSIYLYRANDGQVLDQSTIRPLDEFPDRGYLSAALEYSYSGVWSSPRPKNEAMGSPQGSNVTSLGFKIPRSSGSLGYLMVNVKLSSLDAFIDRMIDRDITNVRLFDAQGRSFDGENIAIDSPKKLSVDIVSDYTGWTYRIGIKGGQLFDFLLQGSAVWIWLGLGCIVFAIVSTFFVTRRSYKPIESIMRRIERFSTSGKAERKGVENEFAFIDQAIERLITNNMAFQEQQQENLVIRRQQFLQQLLKGELEEDRDAWEPERMHYGLELGHFIVGLLELDQYVQFGLKYSANDQSLFKFIISSVALEIAEQNGQRLVTEWIAKNRLVLLLISEDSETLEHRMLQLAEQIRFWVEDHLDFTVTIGIGTAAGDEAAIANSFENAEAAVSRKVSLGANQIISAVEVKDKPDGEWFAYLEMIRSAVRQLRLSDPEWTGELKRLFGEMARQRLRKDDVERLLHYLVFHLEYELEGSLPDAIPAWTADIKPALLAAMEQSDTLRQLEDGFVSALERLSGLLEELSQNRRHHTLMREIRDYVAENFLDPNLSLTLLSDRFQINPKYLSQLFKESIGENFSDFLIGLRIDHAKRLLRETDETVQDISERIGYANPTSFIRVFKKVVGLSPGQYRESGPRGMEPGE